MPSNSNVPGVPRVLIWDPNPERRAQIIQVLREGGMAIHPLEHAENGGSSWGDSSAMAIVALGKASTDHEIALSLVRALRKNNTLVLAFEDGSSQWPLGERCHALLAGAKEIFDGAEPEFLINLCRQVQSTLQEISSRIMEEQSIRRSLSDLGVVGNSPAMMAVQRLVVRVSHLSDLPVLLCGETGTGKELLARAIHALDAKRSCGPFVALNCAALPADLAEAELFGHRRGAFTGADNERKGLFRAAEGGVVFLDEIAEMRLDLQSKLLRVLQENRLLVLGDDRETSINVRLLAATNCDLRERVAQGAFRADLFHRLNVIPIHLPPLRERPEDVAPLVNHFLIKHRELNPAFLRAVTQEFIQGLQSTGLPGNARQVENVVRQAIACKEDDGPLGLADLPREVWEELYLPANSTKSQPQTKVPEQSLSIPRANESFDFPMHLLERNEWNLSRTVRHFERLLLDLALHRTHGNQSETARLLGVTPRSIYNKLRQHPN